MAVSYRLLMLSPSAADGRRHRCCRRRGASSATAAGEAGKEQPAGPLDPPPLVLQKAESLDSTTP